MLTTVNIDTTTPDRYETITGKVTTNTGPGTDQSWTFREVGSRTYGENIVGYHRAKAAGALLPHTHWIQTERQVMTVTPGDWYIQWVSPPSIWAEITPYALYLPTQYAPPSMDPSIADYALQRAAAKIYSEGWDALTFAAEAPKTANMIRGFTAKALNLTRNLSRKRVFDMWLEGRYGWRTLAYDVRDIHKAVVEMDSQRSIWSERQGLKVDRSTSSPGEVFNPTNNNLLRVSEDIVLEESYRGAVSAKIEVARARFNPVETAWELVPFSFVLDWVYDVGTAIRALSFAATTRGYTSSIGLKHDYSATYTLHHVGHSTNRQNGRASGSVNWTGSGLSRTPTVINFKPQVTNRLLTPDLALDLTGLAKLRRQYSSRR